MAFYVAFYFLAEHAVKLHQALGLSEQSLSQAQLDQAKNKPNGCMAGLFPK